MNLKPGPGETIEGLSHGIRARERGCAEVLEACLLRIREREPSVRAWVLVDEESAMEQARARDGELAAGRWRGPLHGIPLGIKDIIDVAGLPTAAGSRLWADRIMLDDAEVVARLRDAGAVILGKTVTTPYAWIDPPPTANPWDPARTPGGSSSGSAAAVAAGMCLGALGSQTGGSIIRPAAFCGVAGLKPTFGRLSVAGILPLAPSLDHPGPIARTARDLALLWRALMPDDPAPPTHPRPPRLGRLRGLFEERAEAPALEALETALAAFERAGGSWSETALPGGFGDVPLQHRTIMSAEAASVHEARAATSPEDYPDRISALIDEGSAHRATAYIFARKHQDLMKQSVLACFAEADALITPSAPGPAPDRSTTGDPILNSPWSYTGLPAVTIPVSLSADRLPLGVQLVGRPGAEADLLGVAIWCEAALRGRSAGG